MSDRDRMDRKAELERKKARLAQIRAEKKKKLPKKEEAQKISVTVSSDLDQKRKETEDILRTVGIDYTTQVAPTAEPVGSKGAAIADRDSSFAESNNYRPRQPRAPTLGQSKIAITSIPPKETVSYSKETQTPVEQAQQDSEDEMLAIEQDIKMKESKEIVKETEADDEKDSEVENAQPEIQEIPEEEKDRIESSEDYSFFLRKTSKFMERALENNKVDLFTEYITQVEEESEVERGAKLTLNRTFNDERWSRRRVVTSLDWSTHHPELSLASYSNSTDAQYDPEGIALVWNSKYKTTAPEFTFHCQSPITTACFAKFHPNFVIGGTYSGQIVLWDNRVNKRTAQRSKLSTQAHTHPVYCIDVVGTQNAHNVISISNDGKMCSWSLDMLSQPLEALEMQHKQSKSVAVTAMSFQHNSVNNFAVGAEDGGVYTACRHGNKTGISDYFEGHNTLVSGIDFHRSTGQLDFSHLLLTSSFDWTIKLWSVKESGNRSFLHSFKDRSDGIYDVAWSPTHPALFASVDCGGHLDLWNFNVDTEVPVVSVMVDSGNCTLNKLRWNANGTQIAVGDYSGRVHLYDVGEQIATPRPDEWSRFMRSLSELRSMQQEEEEARMIAKQL